MLISIIFQLFFFGLFGVIQSIEPQDLEIMGIEPNAGPIYGETRVTVRMREFDKSLIDSYPHPKCRFGSHKNTVNATYIKCTPTPRKVGQKEPTTSELSETCIICENSPAHTPDYVPFTISLLGDFTDVQNSIPYRYYKDPVISWIYPRYGPKDGGTFVEVYGENFLNFDQNLRCGFGSLEVQAYYVSDNYMLCYSPKSDVIGQKLPFTVSLNNQQNTKQNVPFVYYSKPQVYRLEPNRGPDTGETVVRIRGQNFNPLKDVPDMNNYNDTFCTFGNLSISNAKVISSTEMECTSPPSFELRQVPVEITLNNREWTDDNVNFYYYHPPFIYFINPKIGPVSGGTEVVITGSNFEDTGYVMCRFGDKYAKGTYVSQNELRCVSPQVEKPGTVGLAVAIRENEFSSGINTKFKYYATPVIDHIEPMCGPERGFTQITIYGTNFPVDDSEYVKCVFDRQIFMNATVMNDHELKCDSPSVLNYNGINENNITEYDVEITLNGVDINGPKQKFYYYKETFISAVDPIFGPIEGNTTVNITGGDFAQKGACNVTVRFATYQVKPETIGHNYMVVKSPAVNFTGAVVVQVALNGRQFDKDITVRYRDESNTFYYYKFPLVTEMRPIKGTTIGGTEIDLQGVGFKDPFYATESITKRKLYYRFIDCNNEKIVYSQPGTHTIVYHNHNVKLFSPKVYKNNTQTCVQLSYNQEDYVTIKDSFTFYVLPNITNINPKYGPLVTNDYEKVKVSLDNYYCVENCNDILCRYKSKNNIFFEKGSYIAPNTVNCTLPKVNIPDSFNLEVSFNNGEDFTNNGFQYTFYDPYVIKVEPQMVSSKGGTKIRINGYGFANSGDNLKVKFGDKVNTIKCNYKTCVRSAEYIDENNIVAETYPRSEVNYELTGEQFGYERFAVEVSVYNDDFTNNNVTIFYYDEPEIIENLYDVKVKMDPKIKQAISDVLVRSIPANLDTMIPIPVNSTKIIKYFKQMEPYANFTCRYQIKDDTTKEIVTYGIITSFPSEPETKNLFVCQSPVWNNVGPARIQISLNGFDFSDSEFSITFTDPINLLKIDPPCGPLNGGTVVQLYGTGFDKKKDHVFKWGPQNLVPMDAASFMDEVKASQITPNFFGLNYKQTQFKISKMNVKAPTAPDHIHTNGGMDYIAISKLNALPKDDFITMFYANNYIHTNFEYYYYKQPYVQSFSPKGSVVTGGTQVLVVGAWFQYKPEYGVKPYCKFGNKIVEGKYLSTVRILCEAPAYPQPNVRVPFCVSLNKYDFVCAQKQFTYYNDFTHAKFEKMVPQSGPDTGGTQIKIFGQNFTNLVTPEEFLCQFKPEDSTMAPKNVPAGYQEYPKSNQSAIICNTPGGWSSGTKASILITFDGQNFMDTNFDFYFYKVDYIRPRAGPTTGNGPINVVGGGFINSTKVKCNLNNADYKPVSINEHKIQCPMPPVYNNFTGSVDFGIMINGIDPKTFPKGFYYYDQITVDSIFPPTGPSKGNALVKVFGNGFRNDFPGVELGCKVGNYYGRGEYVSNKEMNCIFNKLPLIENNKTMLFSAALNNYSFTAENSNLTFTPYGIIQISPSSGPINGGTRIEVHGAGFYDANKIRCRFGVPGYYAYTNAEYIDYNTIVCSAPEDFKVPIAGQLPFSVPFSIAFNDDEFQPWTETSHFFSFYDNYDIEMVTPIEGSTKSTTEVKIFASFDKPFSMPSASAVEEDIVDYSKSKSGSVVSKQHFMYQPITCRFGRFGVTTGEYVNRTVIKCLTPNIQDDSDVGYEEVPVEVALNGVDYFSNDSVVFTFVGPNAGKMLWVYILITIFTALVMIGIAMLISNYWNKIMLQMQESRNIYSGDQPHVVNKQPRYLIPELRQDLRSEFLPSEGNRNIRVDEDQNRRNIGGMVV